MWTEEKIKEVRDEIAKKAATDKEFRARVLAEPEAVIKEVSGMELPADYKVNVIENAPGVSETFVLPDMVSEDLSDEALDDVAGGGCKSDSCMAKMGCTSKQSCKTLSAG